MAELIAKSGIDLFKKVVFVISIAFILIILNSYSQEIGALLVEKDKVTIRNNTGISLFPTKHAHSSLFPYISKFWGKLTTDEIPNNGKKYNCTATIQRLYAVWLLKLSEELGYNSVNEMFDYSLRIVKIKEIMDTVVKDQLKFTSNNYHPAMVEITYPKEKEDWEKIERILNSSWYGKFGKYDAIDKFLIEIGLIDDSDWKSSTWEVFDLMSNKGHAVYEKTDKMKKKGIDIWKETNSYLPLDENVVNNILPGDILTGKYYATHYPERYTTHITVYLGKREETPVFAEQFGEDTRITSLEKMYKALRTGFEAIFRPVIIISKENTQEFLSIPLTDYNFGSQARPHILFFKNEAENFLSPIQVSVNEIIKKDEG
ncbi:MAG: hypothetical protein QME42_06445 [bacterium]|nr:hypothetical protein [bacterium]